MQCRSKILFHKTFKSWNQNLKWLEIKNWNVITIYNNIGNWISNPRQECVYEIRKLWNEWCNQNLHILYRRGQRIWTWSKNRRAGRCEGTQELRCSTVARPRDQIFAALSCLRQLQPANERDFRPKFSNVVCALCAAGTRCSGSKQRQKNLGSKVALLLGTFLCVRKVFAR